MVPWKKFVRFLNVNPITEVSLKYILDYSATGFVTQFKFGEFLKGFGPTEGSLLRVKAIFAASWFHGYLSSAEATRILDNQLPGTFLVRFSQSLPGTFAIAYIADQSKVIHSLIHRSGKDFVLDGVPYPSIHAIVDNSKDILIRPASSILAKDFLFHGDLTSEEAKDVLKNKANGTYLFRFSSQAGFLALSYVQDGTVLHQMIEVTPRTLR
eukprot:TRINITY_DN2496_c0_g1_i1.p1 TRINITY_DN2496_c0_g1~~TRINITY_DN2496_c0_g1_i1.p1  ORF type:complete len:211 (+),score=26.42 TRINITY_DN2496_c0_g1_i1:408-1040(+)